MEGGAFFFQLYNTDRAAFKKLETIRIILQQESGELFCERRRVETAFLRSSRRLVLRVVCLEQ